MMLMLAQSNPQLFALIGTKASINKELERIEQSSKLQHLSATELISRNREHWEAWLQRYRYQGWPPGLQGKQILPHLVLASPFKLIPCYSLPAKLALITISSHPVGLLCPHAFALAVP